jgi:hypothetical protein
MCKKCGKAKCTCPSTCKTCGKSKCGCKASDKKQDAKTTKGMSPAQKAKFEKEDKKMDKKPMSRKEDTKKDNALAKKIKGKK